MVALVLLGAGASFGSKDVSPGIPPLGNGKDGLFARLESRFEPMQKLPDAIKATFRDNFEAGMAKFLAYSNGNTMGFQRSLAHYLAEFSPGKGNEYRRLIDTLGVGRVVYSTLNYDLLFELAAGMLGLNTSYGRLPERGFVRLLKPHGSVNFWPDLPVGMFRQAQISSNGGADVSAPVKPLSQADTLYRCQAEDSMAPAIAIYAEGKPVKVCPDYVRDQQAQWSHVAQHASRVFISGVRVNDTDTHLWGTLAASKSKVIYFGLDGDAEGFHSWQETAKKKNAYFVRAYFSQAIDSMARRLR